MGRGVIRKLQNNLLGGEIDCMNDRYLYRGVNQKMYQSSNGVLCPKLMNCLFTYVFKADGSIKADGNAIAGPSKQNAVLGHQLNSDSFPTSGISTTPIFERAQHYATNGEQYTGGYVFKLDRELLGSFGVEEYIVSKWVKNPSKPEDEEVILVPQDLRELPTQVIVGIIEVSAQPGAGEGRS